MESKYDYVVFDIETTGLHPESDQICEIAAIGVKDGLPQGLFSTLVAIEGSMPEAAGRVNGITDDMLKGAPAIGDALDAFLDFIGEDAVLAGHNIASFDIPFVQAAAAKSGRVFIYPYVIDTLEVARELWPDLPSRSMDSLRDILGIERTDAHRALADTDNSKYSFSLAKLDADLNANGLEERFLQNVEADIEAKGAEIAEARAAVEAERQRVTGIRDAYLEDMRKTYLDYRKKAHGLEGTALAAFPKLELKRPPKEVMDDPEVKRLWLAYRRGADELRVEMASEVPYARKPKKGGGTSGSGTQPRREAPSMGKDERGHERPDVR